MASAGSDAPFSSAFLQDHTFASTADTTGSQWVPSPPVRPIPPLASKTLLGRSHATEEYITRLKKSRDAYRLALNETTQKIVKHYETLRDSDVELVQFVGASWLNETERLIKEAKTERKLLEEMLKEYKLKNHRNLHHDDEENDDPETTITKHRRNKNRMICMLEDVDEDDYIDGVPSQLRCPITLTLMVDPVIAADGNVYERHALEEWFSRKANNGNGSKATSPLTGNVLPSQQYFPCHTIRDLCQKFRDGKHSQPHTQD